jgi:hypothetical protein
MEDELQVKLSCKDGIQSYLSTWDSTVLERGVEDEL